jgi:hypothetical protein
MVQREYEFNYGEPGLFMEIYVAKKAEFQPLLYETLTAGFNLKKVRSHFRSKAEAIRRFMRRNRQLHDFSSYRINHFGNVFTGYSLYEVDGTFDGGAQERTQVVRVIFVPPLAQFSKGLKIPPGRRLAYASHFLRFWTHNADSYDAHRNATVPFEPGERDLVRKLSRWLDDVGLFATGYLLYEICTGISELHRHGLIRKPEKELWVTSFRDFALNRLMVVSGAVKMKSQGK